MKKILIFGGSGGIGQQLVKELSNDYEITSFNSLTCDVTDEKQVCDILTNYVYDIIIYLSVKNIDNLICNTTTEDIKKQLDVNIYGLLNVLRYCTPKFKSLSYGRFIYVSSILSKNPIKGTGIYSASKSFCESIIKTYSIENSKYGITSNSIQLGYFDDGLTNNISSDILTNVIQRVPLKRLGKINEICPLIKAIIETEYINGSIIPINGGYGY